MSYYGNLFEVLLKYPLLICFCDSNFVLEKGHRLSLPPPLSLFGRNFLILCIYYGQSPDSLYLTLIIILYLYTANGICNVKTATTIMHNVA